MGFTDELSKRADEVIDAAVRKKFEEDDYYAEWGGDDHQRDEWWHVLDDDKETLTLDRYLSGPQKPAGKGQYSDKNNTFVALKGSEVWKYVADQFSWAKDSIMEFGKATPSTTKALRDDAKNASLNLCADKAWSNAMEGSEPLDRDFGGAIPGSDLLIENVIKELEYWSGDFANSFILTFGNSVEKWEEIVQGNFYLGALLTESLDAQTAVTVAARDDVMEILDSTEAALGKLGSGDEVGASTLLAITGALIGVTLTVASFGTAAAVVGAAFAVTTAVVSAAEKNGQNEATDGLGSENINISGENAFWTLNSMCIHLGKVQETMGKQEEKVKDVLWEAYNVVLANRNKYEVSITADTGNMGSRETGAETNTLKAVAETDFPAAAAALLKANEKFGGMDAGSAFKSDYSGYDTVIKYPWEHVRDLLVDVSGRNAEVVAKTGQFLFNYASDSDVVDNDAAGKIYEEIGDIEKSGRDHEPYEEPERPPGGQY